MTQLQTWQEKGDDEIIVRAQGHCCYYLMFTQCDSKLFYPVVINILQKYCFRILLQKKQATILILYHRKPPVV